MSDLQERPLVTYILASFNHAAYVSAAIDSIISQDYSPIQLIVIDDGSTDGSIEILTKLQDKYEFHLITQKNAGIAAVINRGVQLSQGAFIVPHASDDVSHRGRTSAQVNLLINNPNAGFTVGGIRKISPDGCVLQDWQESKQMITTFNDFVNGKGGGVAVSCMYRARALSEIGQLDERLTFEDVQLYWRVTELGYDCLIDTSVHAVDYRIIPNSLGRHNLVPHRKSFLLFLERYCNEVWYFKVRTLAKAGLFSALAERDRIAAVGFLFKNCNELIYSFPLLGIIKLFLPKSLLRIIKKKY